MEIKIFWHVTQCRLVNIGVSEELIVFIFSGRWRWKQQTHSKRRQLFTDLLWVISQNL